MKRRTFIKTNLNAAAAVSVGAVSLKAKNMKKNKITVGFSKASLVDCIKSDIKFRRELEAIVTCIRTADSTIAIIALDLIYLLPLEHNKLQKEISDICALPTKNIIIHTTHTHSSPWDLRGSETAYVGLPEKLAQLISNAEKLSVACSIKFGKTYVGQKLSIYRRKNTGEDLGVQTYWLGFDYKNDPERSDASLLINDMKARWSGKESGYKAGGEPVYFDEPVDPLAHAIQFIDEKGKTVGSISSFAAHPHLGSACKENLFDPDYPGFVRDTMENKLGGVCMFLLAPCADLVPKEKIEYQTNTYIKLDKYYFGPTWAVCPKNEANLLLEMKRIGDEVGSACIKGLNTSSPDLLGEVNFIGEKHKLPLDPAFPKEYDDIAKTKAMLIPEYEAFLKEKAPLREMRRLANRINWLDWSCDKYFSYTDQSDRDDGEKEMPMSVLKLQDVILVFLHSEIALETNLKIRKKYKDQNVVLVSLTGGYMGYYPTAKMIDEGGYEGRSTLITRDAEEKLRDDICKKVDEVLRG